MIFSNIVGSFLSNKGIHIYLKAINNINCSNCKFELVGKFGIDEEYNKLIKKLLSESKNVEHIDFIENIRDYYKYIDVVILTSIKPEALGLVLIEGAAMGKILIASDIGGVREVVKEEFGNILIPPNNIEALREAIIKVSQYPTNYREEIGRKNIKFVKKNFSLKNQIEKLTKIYKQVIEE